jgi:hypothetical protein
LSASLSLSPALIAGAAPLAWLGEAAEPFAESPGSLEAPDEDGTEPEDRWPGLQGNDPGRLWHDRVSRAARTKLRPTLKRETLIINLSHSFLEGAKAKKNSALKFGLYGGTIR